MVRPSGRHIDTDARMIWMTLRSEARAMSATQVRHFWSPTFSRYEVEDALQRLVAGKHLEAVPAPQEKVYFVSEACVPLPGFAVAATRPALGAPTR